MPRVFKSLIVLLTLLACGTQKSISSSRPDTGGDRIQPRNEDAEPMIPQEDGTSGPVGTGKFLIYNVEQANSTIQGSVAMNATAAKSELKFKTVNADDFGYSNYRSRYKTVIARFASDSKNFITLTLPSTPNYCELRSPAGLVPSTISGNKVSFQLPQGAGVYYLKTDVKIDSTQDYIETIVFWVDDYNSVITAAPSGAVVIHPGQSIQAAVDSATIGSSLYIAAGTHSFDRLFIKDKKSLTIIMHPDAVLLQSGPTEAAFIEILNSDNIVLKGPGIIQSAKGNQKTVLYVNRSKNVLLSDFFLYKVHHRDGWTLHIYKTNTAEIKHIRIISGNDGTDPDSSQNVKYFGLYIEAQDDAFAAKTRGGEVIDGLQFDHGLVRSAASALKIGESTVDDLITNVKFTNSTVFDSDRGLVVIPNGDGRIGSVLYQNIRVKSVRKNKFGRSIWVMKSAKEGTSSNIFDGAQITFDKIEADVLDTIELQPKVTFSNSSLSVYSPLRLFTGTCPTQSAVTIQWLNGTGNSGC